MKKNDGLALIAQVFNGLNISISMMVFFCLCSYYKEYLPDAERVGETHEAFNQSLLNALDGEKVISPTIIKNGHAFLDELEKFQTLPPAKNKEIKKLIGDMRKDTREVLRAS